MLLPRPGHDELTYPIWNGNEFLCGDGSRPWLRTLTPRRHDPVAGSIDVETVLHGDAPLSAWAVVGSPVAVSGPGRGYAIDADAHRFVLGARPVGRAVV